MCCTIDNYINKAWSFILDNFRMFCIEFAKCLGVLSAIVTILSVWPDENKWSCYLHIAPFVCLGIALIWAVCKIVPREHISITFHKNDVRTIEVRKGDIWSIDEGIVIIPVNNFFDTQVDDIIIAKRSLHGQFIEQYRKRYPKKNLDNEINASIKRDGISFSGTYQNRNNLHDHNHEHCYPLGTVVRLIEGKIQYYLVVATEFDKNNHVISEPEKFSMMLLTMIKKINEWNSGVRVYLPIIGAGQTGLPLTKQEILTEILSCFNLAKKYVAFGGTTILVYKGDMKEISLNKIDYQFRKI
ncbi:MAG: DUF6430 domain-containing protein [Prevotella sp.]|nr:DUF6430 domain-containing protein [Prevotella sp.]